MNDIPRYTSRADIPQDDTWATEDLFASEALWEENLQAMAQKQEQLRSYAGRLTESAQTLYEYLRLFEAANVQWSKLSSYCNLKKDEDTRNAHYQALAGRFSSALISYQAELSFQTPEIMALTDKQLEDYFASCPELERYRRYLKDVRRMKAHTLSPQEERILAAADELGQAPYEIFGALEDADMVYPEAVDGENRIHPLNGANFVPLQYSADRKLRQSAYENMYDTLAANRNTFAAMLNAQNRQTDFFAKMRRYTSAFEASLDATQVPQEVYGNLIDTVHQHLNQMHRYVRLRKKMLGVDQLHFYDVYVPLVQEADRFIPLEEAKKTVYQALEPMGEEYRCILKHGMESRWIDAYPNDGKRGGAYSSGSAVHPYVLMNYAGTLKSQFTLAHEMGHALHSYLSNHNQNPIDARYVIFVAEVASTCNEALLMQYLLNGTKDKKERIYLVNYFLEQFKGIIFRQTMFAEFERNIGRVASEGKTLTADLLCEEYKRLNEAYFGPDMVVDQRIAMEWARIPHFYYDYYVFQYATGFSAAIAISKRILAEGAPAAEAYLKFLSSGCTKPPIELLKDVGVDMTDSAPVNDALCMFSDLLDEMEALLQE